MTQHEDFQASCAVTRNIFSMVSKEMYGCLIMTDNRHKGLLEKYKTFSEKSFMIFGLNCGNQPHLSVCTLNFRSPVPKLKQTCYAPIKTC